MGGGLLFNRVTEKNKTFGGKIIHTKVIFILIKTVYILLFIQERRRGKKI